MWPWANRTRSSKSRNSFICKTDLLNISIIYHIEQPHMPTQNNITMIEIQDEYKYIRIFMMFRA
jgi:hypothetical protein